MISATNLNEKSSAPVKKLFVIIIAFAWVFSGWPQITIETRYGDITFPEPVPVAYAATTTQSFTSTGYTTWTVPVGVTVIDVACWGGGGAGFGGTISNNAGGGAGGGGGAFASSTQTVSASDTIRIFVGAGGAASAAGGATSTASTTAPATIVTAASGGAGLAQVGTGGLGGPTGISVGTSLRAGGPGGNGVDGGSSKDWGGGGGGAGGPHTTGGTGANGATGGTTAGGQGDGTFGGTGGTGSNNGSDDTTLGGGGGGGAPDNATGGDGGLPGGGGGGAGQTSGFGTGANGQCIIYYTEILPTVATDFESNVNATTAHLNGRKTGGGDATGHGFAYGTDATFATVIATTTLGSLASNIPFRRSVSSLSADTTYFFRAYATNTAGVAYGVGRNFVTGNNSVTRRLRLFNGYNVKFREGRMILYSR